MDKKTFIKINLAEAGAHIDEALKKYKSENNNLTDFETDVQHIISHLYMVYNSRKLTDEELNDLYEKDYKKLGETPDDLYLLG